MFSSIFGDLEETEAWRGVAVRVDHDVPGAGDRQVLASLVAAWVAICNIYYVSQMLLEYPGCHTCPRTACPRSCSPPPGRTPKCRSPGSTKLDMYPTKLSACQVNVVWFKLSLCVNLSVGLSAVRILVSRSSQEQVVAFLVHRHSPHLVVDVPWKDRSWCPSPENHIRFENPESLHDSPCIEAPWLPISPSPELLLGCTVHLGNEYICNFCRQILPKDLPTLMAR